jgi:RHS repeat-associated protein
MRRRIQIGYLLILIVSLWASAGYADRVYFYHTDPAGTPMVITDTSGAVVWRASYKPFGEEEAITGEIENQRMFVGKEKDKETGLYYFGARYMNDKIGRFISVDPIGPVDEKTGKVNEKMLLNPQKLNKYAYGLNNPYRYVDRDGMWPEEIHNEIIRRAFSSGKYRLSPAAIAALMRGSRFADSRQFQDTAHSYMHAMRAPGQTVEEAERLMNNFIRQQVADYKRLMAEGKTDEAYFALGMAMHPLMDATSPAHEGMQEWKGLKGPIKLLKASYHFARESELFFTQEDLIRTVNRLREFYDLINK